MKNKSVKDRVRKYGEVKTQHNEVKNMLKLVSNEIERVDSRFLEPACGDGNFLTEILLKKLNIAYKKYQIMAQKEKHNKISREFAIRRINNLKFIEWSQSNVGGYYNYLSQKGI